MSSGTATIPALRLRLLGPPRAMLADGAPIAGLAHGKPLALLCYLARNGEARREELTALLWGDAEESRARNAFRQSLHRLRGALGGVLLQPPDRLALRLDGELWIDTSAFDAAVDAHRHEEAVELYTGDFLDGFSVGEPSFDHWADRERSLLRGRFVGAAEQAIASALAGGRTADAVRWSERLSAAAPLESASAMLHARSLVAHGRRAEAVALLRAHVFHVQEELGMDAPREVRDALMKLGEQAPRTVAAAAPAPARGGSAGEVEPPLFVGRSPELARLLGGWQRAKESTGSTVLVEAPAGAGKTRLLDEFAATLRALDAPLVLHGREHAGGTRLPYAPVAEALRAALRAPGLAGASEHLLAEAARLVPELRDRFRLPDAAPVEDDAARLRFFEGVAAVLEAVAYESPLCLLLDDVGESAQATHDLLGYLAARLRGVGVLMVLVARPPREDGSAPGRLSTIADEVIQLAPLGGEEAETLVRSLPASSRLPADGIRRIVALGEGNPLRLAELTRRALAGEPLAAPIAGLKEILWARLESHPPAHRRLFLASALLGRPAPLRLLAAAAHLSEAATLDAALALEADRLLVQDTAGIRPAHALAAELGIQRAGAAGRALIAGWLADAAALHGEAHAAELAQLYARAGRPAETFRYASDAATQAFALGAWNDAVAYLQLAARYAPDPATRAEVETRLDALGAGPARLPAAAGAAARTPQSPVQATSRRHPRTRMSSRLIVAGAAVVLLATVALLLARSARQRPVGHVLADTVLLVESNEARQLVYFGGTGALADAVRQLQEVSPRGAGPAWIDSLALPWMNARPSPAGNFVALERMSAAGPDVYIISADRRDTTAIAAGTGDDTVLGWSPDGRALLVSRSRTRADGSYDTDLFAIDITRAQALPLDTLSDHEVVDAAWSPAGAHIAWVARIGAEDQREIFVSRADGSAVRNVSLSPAEDYSVAWGPDGSRIAFTSERDGNAEIYAAEIPSAELSRLTFDEAQDDRAIFSPDDRFVAFESTRGGEAGVYVIASRGGQPARVTPPDRRMSLAGWRGRALPYVDLLRLAAAGAVPVADTVTIAVEALRSDGSIAAPEALQARALDPDTLAYLGRDGDGALRLAGVQRGLARVELRLPGWRVDTVRVLVGAGLLRVLRDEFAAEVDARSESQRWLAMGQSSPQRLDGVLVPRAGKGAQSGLLSGSTFPLEYGLSLRAGLRAPFGASVPATLTVALVSPPRAGARLDAVPTPLASVSWIGEAGRLVYSVERERHTEPVAAVGAAGEHHVEIRVDAEGFVSFFVDGSRRWRSTLRLPAADAAREVKLWVGGQTTREDVGVVDAEVWVGGAGR